jgi:RND family efflux transporter MFP subunit
MTELSTPSSETGTGRHPKAIVGFAVAALAVAIIIVWGLISRSEARAALDREASAAGVTTVIAARAQTGPALEEVVLPGQVKGDYETPVYARTNGYLASWKVDIGAHVKAGQLLATIESPEVDQQLRQAEADLKTAQANAIVAKSTAARVAGLVETQSVSRQEGEDRAAAAAATAAQVASNQANVARLRQLQSFERVVAPFAGVITARSTDVGALINAGQAQGSELFRIAAVGKLRTYVDVPQSYASDIRQGTGADLQFPDKPGKLFPATVTRTASAIDPTNRTLQVELDIANADGALFPGAFTQVHFKLPPAGHGVQIPSNALLFGADGVQVAKVSPQGVVNILPVTLGRDFGTSLEILTGVGRNDQVVINPSGMLASGDKVRVVEAPKPKAAS